MFVCNNCGHMPFVPLAKAEYKACPSGFFTVRLRALDSNGRMKKLVEDIHDQGLDVLDGLVNLTMQGRARLNGCGSPACSPRQEGRTAIYRWPSLNIRDTSIEWCRRKESNLRPRPYQGRALPLSYGGTGCAAHHAIGAQSAQPAWAQSVTQGGDAGPRKFHRKRARSGTPALDARVPSLHHARCRFCRPGGSIS